MAETEKQSLGFVMDDTTASKDPDVLPPSADVSFPPLPTFNNLDQPTDALKIGINKEVSAQINHLKVLNQYIEDLRVFIPFLYSYRSLFRATMKSQIVKDTIALADDAKLKSKYGISNNTIPPEVCENQPENYDEQEYQNLRKACIFKKNFWDSYKERFLSTFNQLQQLQTRCEEIAKQLKTIFETQEYTQPTDVIFERLIDLFGIIFNVDELKRLKPGFGLDLANYKRCFDPNELVLPQNQGIAFLPIFLSTPHVTLQYISEQIFGKDKKKPQKSKCLPFLTKLLEYCIKMYRKSLLTPEQRSSVLLTMCSVLFFHGTSDKKNQDNIYNTAVMQQVWEIISENPVIPLYADNSFVPGYDLPKTDGYFNNTKFDIAKTQTEIMNHSKQLLVNYLMPQFREQYRKNLQYASDMAHKQKVSVEALISLLSCLSDMTFAIQRQSALKFICFAQRPEYATKEKTGMKELKYDLTVKFNYTKEDLNSLVELIGYIKTLAATVILAEPTIYEYTNKFVYGSVQEFIQNTLERPYVRSRQTNDTDAQNLLHNIRDLFGYWKNTDPDKGLTKKMKTKAIKTHKFEPSYMAVSSNQLNILRIQLQSIIHDNSPFTKKISAFQLSHFRPKHVNQTQEFLEQSRPWYHLLNYIPVIRQTTNLSFLWLRETSLDVDEELQFPVRSSLPFILAEHVLNVSDKPSLHDSTFFPFELYNDAAYSALYTFNSQYLFREVEAEVSLCVDMIAFSFAETFYKFCRSTSSAMELPPECIGKISPPPMRYSVMLQQNKFSILGTSIDFNQITTTKLNTKLRQELEAYIQDFTDFRLAPYYAHLVRVARTSHSLLCDNHLRMDDFDMIWQQARLFDSPPCLESRLAFQISQILDFSHWRLNCVSRRYLANKPLIITPISNEPWAKEYASIHQHEMEFIGVEHIRAIIELLSEGELSYIISRLTERLEEQASKIIEIYTKVASVLRLLPAISKDDIVGYYSFNSDAYSSVSHPQLRSLFDGMRALGNTLVFLWYLENELPSTENANSIMAPVMKTLCNILVNNRGLFFSDNYLDLDSVVSHRSFPSLWSVLEFIICSPEPVKLDESKDPVVPFEYLGDGPVIAAHVFITLCNQSSLYKFDSMCFRTLELLNAEQTNIPNEQLSKFVFNAAVADQCRKFAELIATPFQVQFAQE